MTELNSSGAQWTPEMPVPTRPSAVRISTMGTIQELSAAVESAMSLLSGMARAYVSTEVMTAPSSPGCRSAIAVERRPRAPWSVATAAWVAFSAALGSDVSIAAHSTRLSRTGQRRVADAADPQCEYDRDGGAESRPG